MGKLIQTLLLSTIVALGNNTNAQTLNWARQQGGTGQISSTAVALDSNSNIFTTGYFYGTTDFDPGASVFNLTSAGGADSYISKIDPSGNLLWAKQLSGTSDIISSSIAVDDSGNVYTTGTFKGAVDFDPGAAAFNLVAAGNQDVYISKLTSNGTFVWAKKIGAGSNETSNKIKLDANGNVYITGYYESTVDFDPGAATFNLSSPNGAAYILKLNNTGNFVFAKQFTGGNGAAEGYAIALDANQNIYTTGLFVDDVDFDPSSGMFTLNTPIAGLITIYISKLDALGNFVWAKKIDGNDENYPNDIDVDMNGNVITIGSFRQTSDFDPGIAVNNLVSNGGYDNYILKLDALGNFVWVKQIGGTSSDFVNGLCLDGSNNIYFTGDFANTVDFNPGANTNNLSAVGSNDIFLASLDQSGNYAGAVSMGGINYDAGTSIAINAVGEIFITGIFQGVCDFDPTVGVNNLTSYGNQDAFIVKLNPMPTGVEDNFKNVLGIAVYPNPVSQSSLISLSLKNKSQVKIEVMDITGKTISTITDSFLGAGENKIQWNTEKLNPGMYLLKINNEPEIITYKIIKL